MEGSRDLLVILPTQLRMAEVGRIRADMLAALEAEGSLILDGRVVERVDAAGLQLLVSLMASAAKQGRALEWRASSRSLNEAARLAGLDAVLRLPAEA